MSDFRLLNLRVLERDNKQVDDRFGCKLNQRERFGEVEHLLCVDRIL